MESGGATEELVFRMSGWGERGDGGEVEKREVKHTVHEAGRFGTPAGAGRAATVGEALEGGGGAAWPRPPSRPRDQQLGSWRAAMWGPPGRGQSPLSLLHLQPHSTHHCNLQTFTTYLAGNRAA